MKNENRSHKVKIAYTYESIHAQHYIVLDVIMHIVYETNKCDGKYTFNENADEFDMTTDSEKYNYGF